MEKRSMTCGMAGGRSGNAEVVAPWRRLLRLLLILPAMACAWAFASPVEDCDRLAAHPDDPLRQSEGVFFDDIAMPDALEACGKALESRPDNARLAYQYGRTLLKAGREAEAVEWIGKAATAGYAHAYHALGVHEEVDKGRHGSAFAYYLMAAQLGHVPAMTLIGRAYQNGRGVLVDSTSALAWLRQAAQLGDTEAQMLVGIYYFNGIGVIEDMREAAGWFSMVGDADPYAMMFLGSMYLYGTGVGKDEARAFGLFRKAAGKGASMAMAVVGELYLDGNGVARDEEEGLRWLRQAHERGEAYGSVRLGSALLRKANDSEARREGLKILVEAAEDGNAEAAERLWSAYHHGDGVTADERKARRWMTEFKRLDGESGSSPGTDEPSRSQRWPSAPRTA